METIAAVAVLSYVIYEVNRRTKRDEPIEKAVDHAELEAPTPTSSNPITAQQGHPNKWRKPNENHKQVFSRLMNIKPRSPLYDLSDQHEQTVDDQKEHEAKTLEKLVID